jgi:thermostable 8-oxoguanine DNA glycosylase
MNKEEWHEYFIKNKHRFTSDKREAIVDKTKIFIDDCSTTVVGTETKKNSKINDILFEMGQTEVSE